MAIRIIEGVPGSGKSYYAMHHLCKNYFEKQADGRYELIKPVTIITNIDSFKPEHLSLKELAKEAGGMLLFFAEDYQKELTEKIGGQIIYIIDEAQKIFRKGARDKELPNVYSYFEYHRHFGHDIYLITQNAKKLPSDISLLVEYLIVAAPRTRSVIGEFKYKWMNDGDIIKREAFRPDQGIFGLYKSMDSKESEKIKNPVMKSVGLGLVAVILVFCGGLYYFKTKWLDPAKAAAPGVPVASASKPSPSLVKSPSGLINVPISVITETFNENGLMRNNQLILVSGCFVQKMDFPYTVRRVGGQWFASVPPDIAASLLPIKAEGQPAEDDRRNDSASGSAHDQTGGANSPHAG